MIRSLLRRIWGIIKPSNIYDVSVGLAVLIVGVPILYWAVLDNQPAAESVAEVVTAQVKQGGLFQIHYNVRWARSCRLQGYRFIIDSMGVMHTITPDDRWVNEGRDEFTISVPVPLAAVPGPATYKATLIYECNPWQRWISPLQRETVARAFTIVPADNTSGGLSDLEQRGTRWLCPNDAPVKVDQYCRARPRKQIAMTAWPF